MLLTIAEIDMSDPDGICVRMRLYAGDPADVYIGPSRSELLYLLDRMAEHVEGTCQLLRVLGREVNIFLQPVE
jgi:hypothetical protein